MCIKKVFIFVLIFILSFMFLFSCQKKEEDNLKDSLIENIYQSEKVNDLNVVYKTVNNKNLLMDIYYPTNIKYDKSPLVVGFHGGGWIAGDKTQLMYIFTPIIEELLSNGYIIAMPQYRYAEDSSYFPAQIEDCTDAIEYLKDNAEKYSIDTDSIGVMGYSAGAQLAMLSSYATDLDIKYCLSFAGPSKMYGEELNDYPETTINLIENLFNGVYSEKANDYMSGSPYFYIDSQKDSDSFKKVPLFLVHDEYDNVVPFTQSEVMYDIAVKTEIPCELLKLSGFYHQINFSDTNYYETTPTSDEAVKIILDFIYKYS